MVRINGEWYRQEDIPSEKFKKMLEKRLDDVMQSMGFKRKENI